MSRSKLPRGLRKFIRIEKARIRRSAVGVDEKAQRVRELMARYQNMC